MSEPKAAILAEIERLLRVELEVQGPVSLDQELARDLQVDSMGAIVLAVGLEDRFRVKLSDEDAFAVITVGDLVDLVERRLRSRAPGEPSEAGGAEGAP